MRRSRRHTVGRAGLLAALLVAAGTPAAESDALFKPRRFMVESTPEGADVFVIGGRRGRTPLSLSERDIYPNWYPDDQAHLYGMVILRKAGCAEYSRRLSLDDIKSGLQAQLDCHQQAVPAEPAAVPPAAATASGPGPEPEVSAPASSAALMQRRLLQLKVLQELLDDGLITETEERTIRRRILAAP